MNKLLPFIMLFASGLSAQINVPPPHIVNAAGGSTKIAGGNYYAFNIGEAVVGTVGAYYTQGFLQPDYAIGNAFNARIYFGNESCQGANDGYIVANVYNNKGPIHYSLPTSSGVDTTSTSGNLTPGTYTLTISDSINHPLIKIVTINASNEICPVTVHNAFSPNGDGLNETFAIDGIENYPNNHVYIFNRWGQGIWDEAHYNNTSVAWDGKDTKKERVYPGTYFYIIEIDTKKPMKGWVEITSVNK